MAKKFLERKFSFPTTRPLALSPDSFCKLLLRCSLGRGLPISLRLAHYFFGSKKVDQKTAVHLKNSATLLFPRYPALAGLRSVTSRRSEFSRMTGILFSQGGLIRNGHACSLHDGIHSTTKTLPPSPSFHSGCGGLRGLSTNPKTSHTRRGFLLSSRF